MMAIDLAQRRVNDFQQRCGSYGGAMQDCWVKWGQISGQLGVRFAVKTELQKLFQAPAAH
jgi:hypothetical protein